MKIRRLCSWLLIFALSVSMVSVNAFADETNLSLNTTDFEDETEISADAQGFANETDRSYITTGSYSYTSNEGGNVQKSDTFTFREDCFMRSSFLGCDHLMLLSAQASIASVGWFGPEEDPYEKDLSDNGYNIKNMLAKMGFEDVEANQYYSLERLENSAAAAVGHRTISAFGKDYTLLAIIPGSAGYKQEWSGNLDLGTGHIHEGFKAGRDEILRFVRQYIDRHGISGDLKVWIAGHSRGAAISNLLGGFFAAGGISYFGDAVSITPEDVYCYTFATPKTIRDGLSLAEALSVEGDRGGVYACDTPGEAYVSDAEGMTDPQAAVYGGIRNYPLNYDLITYFPMEEWGYTYYGSILDITEGLSADAMAEEAAAFDPFVYDALLNGGDYREFREKTFDPASLSITDKENGNEGRAAMAAFVQRMITGFRLKMGSGIAEYVESGNQTAMQAVAGLCGMLFVIVRDKAEDHADELILPAVLGCLAYASQQLCEEGRADSDARAAAITLKGLLSFVTGEQLGDPADITVDDCIVILGRYLADHPDSELVKKLEALIDDALPDKFAALIPTVFGAFHPDKKHATPAEMIINFLYAAANGVDPGAPAYRSYKTPEQARTYAYALLSLFPAIEGIKISDVIRENGSGSFEDVVNTLLPLLLEKRDGEGLYSSIAEAADAAFIRAFDIIMTDVYPIVRENYTDDFAEMVQGHAERMRENMTILRESLFNILFYTGNEFSTEANICNLCTLVGNAQKIPPAHYNEVFIAWAKAAVNAKREEGDHFIAHVAYEGSGASSNEHGEYWLLYESGMETEYKDRSLFEEGRLVHNSYRTSIKTATTSRDGSVTTTCTVCKKVHTTVIPAIKKISLSKTSYTYNGKIQKPAVTVKNTAGKKLKEGTDYTVSYGNSKSRKAGSYTVTVKFRNHYSGTRILKYKISKADNKITVTPKIKTISYSALRNKTQAFTLKTSVKEKAEKTYSLVSVPKTAKGSVQISKSGKITIKKGLAKGTYVLRVKVTAKKTRNYNTTAVIRKVTIVVR